MLSQRQFSFRCLIKQSSTAYHSDWIFNIQILFTIDRTPNNYVFHSSAHLSWFNLTLNPPATMSSPLSSSSSSPASQPVAETCLAPLHYTFNAIDPTLHPSIIICTGVPTLYNKYARPVLSLHYNAIAAYFSLLKTFCSYRFIIDCAKRRKRPSNCYLGKQLLTISNWYGPLLSWATLGT